MFPKKFTKIELFQKKKDIAIYKATDGISVYILKGIISEDEALRQAFYDEYSSLHELDHPMIPKYYGICEGLRLLDSKPLGLTILMEALEGTILKDLKGLTIPELRQVLKSIGSLLSYLLQHGILYTDLNPSNIMIKRPAGSFGQLEIHLLDYTFCYYRSNPNPIYPIRFSYDISPELKAQQLLIQELAHLASHILEFHPMDEVPSDIYAFIETGLHPSEDLFMEDYLHLIEHQSEL